jgi:hypothetical protein
MLKALSPLPSTYTPTFGTSGVSGYITAPSLPKPLAVLGGAASILGSALLINDVIGRAGGYKWTQDQLAKIGGGSISRSVPNTNPSSGQQTGVTFYLVFNRSGGGRPSQAILIAQNNVRTAGASVQEALAQHQINGSVGFTAPVSGVLSDTITSPQALTPNRVLTVGTGNGVITVSLPDNSGFSATGASYQKFNYSFGGAIRIDGQPEASTPNQKLPPIPFGYTPTNSPFKNDQDRKVGTPKPLQASRANGLLGAVGLGGAVPTQALSPSPVKPANPNPNPNPSVSPPFAPSPNRSPLPSPAPEKEKEKSPPINPSDNKPPDLRQELTRLGSILALILGATAFDNLKNAAKTGSCETLKSPSCTKDMEDRIKDPIRQDTSNLLQNVGAVSSVVNTVSSKVGDIFKWAGSLYNNQFVQSSINYLTLATAIHNAALLSRDIGETLGSVVDNGLSLAGRQFKNSEGQTVQFSEYVGSNAKAMIVNIIGAERYVELTLNWQKASAIFNSAAQV